MMRHWKSAEGGPCNEHMDFLAAGRAGEVLVGELVIEVATLDPG